jgi:hypothetical protein
MSPYYTRLNNDSLDEEARRSLGQIHPSFMGGEYLPNYRRHEVEIARIELQSTTSDVISLRARGTGLRIKYRLVDEYQTDFGRACGPTDGVACKICGG